MNMAVLKFLLLYGSVRPDCIAISVTSFSSRIYRPIVDIANVMSQLHCSSSAVRT
jgi:hypothetical protein